MPVVYSPRMSDIKMHSETREEKMSLPRKRLQQSNDSTFADFKQHTGRDPRGLPLSDSQQALLYNTHDGRNLENSQVVFLPPLSKENRAAQGETFHASEHPVQFHQLQSFKEEGPLTHPQPKQRVKSKAKALLVDPSHSHRKPHEQLTTDELDQTIPVGPLDTADSTEDKALKQEVLALMKRSVIEENEETIIERRLTSAERTNSNSADSRRPVSDYRQSAAREDIDNLVTIKAKMTPAKLMMARLSPTIEYSDQLRNTRFQMPYSKHSLLVSSTSKQAQSRPSPVIFEQVGQGMVKVQVGSNKQSRAQLVLSQAKIETSLRDKLLSHLEPYRYSEDPALLGDAKALEADRKTFIAQYPWFTLRRFEPKSKMHISKKIKKALNKITQGKALDAIVHQQLVGLVSNLSQQQLNDLLTSQANPTTLQLQILNQTNLLPDKEVYYSCYVQGVKKHFRTLGFPEKLQSRIDKWIEQNDSKRQDVRRIHVKFTRDQSLGFKLEKAREG